MEVRHSNTVSCGEPNSRWIRPAPALLPQGLPAKYDQSFVAWDYGKASAASVILFAIVATITGVQFLLEKKMSND